MDELERAYMSLIVRYFKGVQGRIFFNEQVVSEHKSVRGAVQFVAQPGGPAAVDSTGVIKRAVEAIGHHINMADDAALVGHVGVFTFTIQVAVVVFLSGSFFHGVNGLLEYIVDEFVFNVQLAEGDAVFVNLNLGMYRARAQYVKYDQTYDSLRLQRLFFYQVK